MGPKAYSRRAGQPSELLLLVGRSPFQWQTSRQSTSWLQRSSTILQVVHFCDCHPKKEDFTVCMKVETIEGWKVLAVL